MRILFSLAVSAIVSIAVAQDYNLTCNNSTVSPVDWTTHVQNRCPGVPCEVDGDCNSNICCPRELVCVDTFNNSSNNTNSTDSTQTMSSMTVARQSPVAEKKRLDLSSYYCYYTPKYYYN